MFVTHTNTDIFRWQYPIKLRSKVSLPGENRQEQISERGEENLDQ